MTRVAVLSGQPLLIAGLQAVMERSDRVALTGAFSDIEAMLGHLLAARPEVVLIELSDSMNVTQIEDMIRATTGTSFVLWVDAISVEFASQALAAGVRGLLRKNLSVEMQLRCFEKVAGGELWVEQALSDQLLSTKRVVLTPRERTLVTLLAQGLKNKEMAYTMNITEGTVKVYLSRLFDKVGAKDRFDLALFAWKNFYHSRPNFETGRRDEPIHPAYSGIATRMLVARRATAA